MSPKSLLRHPLARSPIEDFLPGTKFWRVIPEKGSASENADNVERLVFCTGLNLFHLHFPFFFRSLYYLSGITTSVINEGFIYFR